jgi:hypothetical protein
MRIKPTRITNLSKTTGCCAKKMALQNTSKTLLFNLDVEYFTIKIAKVWQ